MDAIDAIKATFFQECEELLGDLETGLTALETGEADSETIHAVFRAVHSVKGGAGAFGLDDLVRFAHVFETALDEMRSGKMAVEPDAVRLMLRAADILSDLVRAARDGETFDDANAQVVSAELKALSGARPEAATPAAEIDFPAASIEIEADDEFGFTPLQIEIEAPVAAAPEGWRVVMRPSAAMYAKANDVQPLLNELTRLGPTSVSLDASELPGLDALDPEGAYLSWTVALDAPVSEDDVRAVFEFVDEDCALSVEASGAPVVSGEPLFESAPAELGDIEALIAAARAAPPIAHVEPDEVAEPAAREPVAVESAASPTAARKEAAAPAQTTIRVDLERVDKLIDLVGELVINQAMLAQRVLESGLTRSSAIAVGLDDLEHLTRDIQDSVMAIRAQPVKSVFQRMPRLVREVAAATGKQVRLITEGEATEVDKTVVERLGEPLTHMIRNAIDHGLETPDVRLAAGKPAEGQVRLVALHRSGRIVIEVSDDGKGIDRARVFKSACDKGLIDPNTQLPDEEIDQLIFMPGFSTASAISDISGRGVGMDVVKRSIQALGGRISISSQPGKGSTFSLSLPLTLAVLDGMVVTAGDQTLIVPLSAMIETLQPKPGEIRRMGAAGQVISVRGTYVPVINVAETLGWRSGPEEISRAVALLVETEGGGRAALVVDAIQGQRQVVIKSLETNYRQVEGIAAATILGDGRVALILDVDPIISTRRRDASRFADLPSFAEAS